MLHFSSGAEKLDASFRFHPHAQTLTHSFTHTHTHKHKELWRHEPLSPFHAERVIF